MREIKFRAWERYLKEIIPVENINFVNRMINTGSAWRLFDEIDLMQYTGLKDKNGKEIYEGDIVEYKHYYAIKRWWRNMNEIEEIKKEVQKARENYATEREKVVFSDGGFYLGYNISGRDINRGELFKKGSTYHSDFEERYWDFEVIGNIYEHPELLEVAE
jgi:uncharacterized phage protein (TIGR01671 family)